MLYILSPVLFAKYVYQIVAKKMLRMCKVMKILQEKRHIRQKRSLEFDDFILGLYQTNKVNS